MSSWYLLILIAYFGVLLLVARVTRGRGDNSTFFTGNHQSPWYLVAFGMVGATISGISVVSVPGMVGASQFGYLQTVLGFFFGYVVVAYVLLPLYYRLHLTSIYEYLNNRFGSEAHRTGSLFFIVAKLVSSATKLYVAALVLQQFIFDAWHIPFWVTVTLCVVLMWLYTRRGGIRTLVWTDSLQTLFLVIALILMVVNMIQLVNSSTSDALRTVYESTWSHTFTLNDWHSHQNFFKQFLSGIFIVIVMTGLDQDMMQKNLTCRTLREAQKNMLWYGSAFIPVNLLLLTLGALILLFTQQNGVLLPEEPDQILPYIATSYFHPVTAFFFMLGIIAASFSSADSALTAITTTISVDLLRIEKRQATQAERWRQWIHLAVCVLFIGLVVAFHAMPNQSIIDTIYTIVGYAYGPLLGLFAFGLLTKQRCRNRLIPVIAIFSPLLTYIIQWLCNHYLNYQFGYELLMLNSLITFVGLWLIRTNQWEVDNG
ncbi:MAG TPA: sodium:solute symporter [Paludibacteraceae bacterium]|nr:sodium:solute symporter [Paludibacteraceae bacterium]